MSGSVDNNRNKIKQNMYEKITRILKYIFHYCEEQEINLHYNSSVIINLLEDETEGVIQIDVDGPWSKNFNVRNFYVEISECFQDKLDLVINHGNREKNIYYRYTIGYNERTQITETVLTTDDHPVIDKDYYLCISIKTTVGIVKNLFHKLKTFLHMNAPNYPTVRIQFNASNHTEDPDSDLVNIKMITDAVDEVLKYSVNNDFVREVYKIFNVDDKQGAKNELHDGLCNCIPDIQ